MEKNTRTTSAHCFFSLATFATALAFSTPSAWAQEVCEADTCPQGFVCEAVSKPCMDLGCVEGGDCNLACEEETQAICVRAACETDADCGGAMVCAEQSSWSCDDAAMPCAEGEDCTGNAEPACLEELRKECTYRWELPCTVAADCGAGFECVEGMSGSCSAGSSASTGQEGATSGSGAATADSGEGADATETPAPQMRAPDCVSEPTGAYYCQLIEVACQQDGDCPEGYSCIDNPEGMCWTDTEGNGGCTTPDPARVCRPPYAAYGGYGVAEDAEGSALDSTAGANTNLIAENPGNADPQAQDAASNGGERADTDGTDQSEEGDDATAGDATATADDSNDSSPTEEPSSSKPESSGCSVQPVLGGQAGSFASVLLGMAMAVAARRRRSR